MAAIITPPGILSFCNTLFVPKRPEEGKEPRYSANLLFDEKAQATPQYKALKEAAHEVAKAKWGTKIPRNLRSPFRDAGEKADKYAGYKDGWIYISAWTTTPPGVVDRFREEIHAASDVFAGQLARFRVRPFAYDASGNQGVAFALEHVQILKEDMPRLDNRVRAEDAFDDYQLDDDETPPKDRKRAPKREEEDEVPF